jgi:putative methyltransferase (TIGR04325 family)
MNSSFKKQIRSLLPPLLFNLKNNLFSPPVSWSGDYKSWTDAAARSEGYDNDAILEKVKFATEMVISGKAAFERDATLFDEIQYSWPVVAGLMKAAASNGGELHILDFGGALGSSYYQNRKFFPGLKELQWYIVEQKSFVGCGKEKFENEHLKFTADIDSATASCNFNVILLSSVLPYLEKPYEILSRLLEIKADYIIIDRTIVLPGNIPDRLTVQMIPASIYSASYPAWIFNESELLDFIGKTYTLIEKFDTLGGEVTLKRPNAAATTRGYIFSRRSQ